MYARIEYSKWKIEEKKEQRRKSKRFELSWIDMCDIVPGTFKKEQKQQQKTEMPRKKKERNFELSTSEIKMGKRME